MQAHLTWKQKMSFDAELGKHVVPMDAKAPVGSDSAASPKQLALAGVAGCTAMDVIALLRKYRQEVTSFSMDADAPTTETHPSVFKEVHLTYRLDGTIEPAKAMEAVELSMTKYCGVSAMIAKACPIRYTVLVNGQEVGRGEARFE